jgi:hypothetical protein
MKKKNGVRIWFDSNPETDQSLIQSWLETNQLTEVSSEVRHLKSKRPYRKKTPYRQKQFSSVLKSAEQQADKKEELRNPILQRIEMYDRRIEERLMKRRQEMRPHK